MNQPQTNFEDRLENLLTGVPRGQHAEHVGQPPNAYFESPANVASTESLRFDPNQNVESKLFLGVVGGEVVSGPRLPDGRVTRWVEGGVWAPAETDHLCAIGVTAIGRA